MASNRNKVDKELFRIAMGARMDEIACADLASKYVNDRNWSEASRWYAAAAIHESIARLIKGGMTWPASAS